MRQVETKRSLHVTVLSSVSRACSIGRSGFHLAVAADLNFPRQSQSQALLYYTTGYCWVYHATWSCDKGLWQTLEDGANQVVWDVLQSRHWDGVWKQGQGSCSIVQQAKLPLRQLRKFPLQHKECCSGNPSLYCNSKKLVTLFGGSLDTLPLSCICNRHGIVII